MKFLRSHRRHDTTHSNTTTDGQMELFITITTNGGDGGGVNFRLLWMDMRSTMDYRKMCMCILSNSMSTDNHLSTSFKDLSIPCTAFVFVYFLSMI